MVQEWQQLTMVALVRPVVARAMVPAVRMAAAVRALRLEET